MRFPKRMSRVAHALQLLLTADVKAAECRCKIDAL